jgi:hypothetical protein
MIKKITTLVEERFLGTKFDEKKKSLQSLKDSNPCLNFTRQ